MGADFYLCSGRTARGHRAASRRNEIYRRSSQASGGGSSAWTETAGRQLPLEDHPKHSEGGNEELKTAGPVYDAVALDPKDETIGPQRDGATSDDGSYHY